jgi:hypothetical protein
MRRSLSVEDLGFRKPARADDRPVKDDRKHSLLRAGIRAALPVLVVGSLLAYWIWNEGEQRKALRELPAADRQPLFERTRQNLQSVCRGARVQRPAGLAGYCREQAEFILQFPECDAECSNLARGLLNQPAR